MLRTRGDQARQGEDDLDEVGLLVVVVEVDGLSLHPLCPQYQTPVNIPIYRLLRFYFSVNLPRIRYVAAHVINAL